MILFQSEKNIIEPTKGCLVFTNPWDNQLVGIVLMIKFDKTVEISSRISGFVGRTISRFSVWEIKVLTINMLVKSLKITCQ
jgi:hypothetical protein